MLVQCILNTIDSSFRRRYCISRRLVPYGKFPMQCARPHAVVRRAVLGAQLARITGIGMEKGWNFFDSESREYFVSHDVIFDEHEFPFASFVPKPSENVWSPSRVGYVDEDEEEDELAGEGEVVQPSSDGNRAPRTAPPVLVPAQCMDEASVGSGSNASVRVASCTEPRSFKEAIKFSQWREAMKKEIDALEDNRTQNMV
ncbi:hypothetical protein LIER_22369 [Lithospermum erythrorhizon]|uniref:Uncharacterized protein n=1 Tax=Lithospermum erythrorhizon TaxID=34254 RepID=A0AAV3QXV6_LITER